MRIGVAPLLPIRKKEWAGQALIGGCHGPVRWKLLWSVDVGRLRERAGRSRYALVKGRVKKCLLWSVDVGRVRASKEESVCIGQGQGKGVC